MITLWYVVKKKLEYFDDEAEITNGFKSINVYDIAEGKIKNFFTLDKVSNEKNSISEIKSWLKDNGYGDDKYKLEEL